jgi:hypothetical protein
MDCDAMSEEEQMFLPDDEGAEEDGHYWTKGQHQATHLLISLPIYSNIHR